MPFRKKLLLSLAVIVAIVVVGTIGYHWLEGWPWFDGLYMTVITLATIGYGETHPLTTGGRVFTLMLIVVGVTVFGFLISILTQALVKTEIAAALERRRMFRDISQLKQHHILCGAGRVGQRIIDELVKKGADFIVIERNEQLAERLLVQGHLVLIGDATDEAVLEGARVRTARTLITAMSSDPNNVYVALTAHGLNPDLYIVARANDQAAERQLRRAGANRVVSPVLLGSHRMAQAALSPAVADFIESTTMTESYDLNFEQVKIAPGSLLDGIPLRDSRIRAEHNAMVVAVIQRDAQQQERMLFNPGGDQMLRSGDTLIAIGTSAALIKLSQIASKE